MIRWTRRLLGMGLALLLVAFNSRLYVSETAADPGIVPLETAAQLKALGPALRRGEASAMQKLFPEGFFFTHALYGLAWVECGLAASPGADTANTAIEEARWALQQLDSQEGRAPFSRSGPPGGGVFYAGWRNWLQGGLLLLQSAEERPATEVAQFDASSAELAAAFDSSSTPFLPSYPGQAWPVDSVVAMAALRLHGHLRDATHQPTVERWLQKVRQRELLPHTVDALSGQPKDPARGSATTLLLRFLVEIDPAWARDQYLLFRERFVDTRLGFTGILEFPRGVQGQGDVDSGPLLLGLSPSGTVVGVAAARAQNDAALARDLLESIESVGMPWEIAGERRYGLGQFAAAEAFLAWSRSTRPWLTQPLTAPATLSNAGPFRHALAHAISLLLLALFFWPDLRRKREDYGYRR